MTDPSTSIHPAPTAEEAAAIVAAVEALWPRASGGNGPAHDHSTTWRFSGRWWRRDRMAPVERPWS